MTSLVPLEPRLEPALGDGVRDPREPTDVRIVDELAQRRQMRSRQRLELDVG
jgi:hypothetical protein